MDQLNKSKNSVQCVSRKLVGNTSFVVYGAFYDSSKVENEETKKFISKPNEIYEDDERQHSLTSHFKNNKCLEVLRVESCAEKICTSELSVSCLVFWDL